MYKEKHSTLGVRICSIHFIQHVHHHLVTFFECESGQKTSDNGNSISQQQRKFVKVNNPNKIIDLFKELSDLFQIFGDPCAFFSTKYSQSIFSFSCTLPIIFFTIVNIIDTKSHLSMLDGCTENICYDKRWIYL